MKKTVIVIAGLFVNFVFSELVSAQELILEYSTYLGGFGCVQGSAIAISDGSVLVAGFTESGDFPTRNPYQSTLGKTNSYSAFLSKLIFYPQPDLLLSRGDYDGDGKSDIAIFRPSIGLWAVRGLGRIYFGSSGDTPISGDYNGDGYTDVGIYRKSSGLWAIKYLTRLYYGDSNDVPVPADYDGDGCVDIGVFDSAAGLWKVRNITHVYYGRRGDIPVPEDYDGDGTDDVAIFRDSSGMWAINDFTRTYYGTAGDIPVTR